MSENKMESRSEEVETVRRQSVAVMEQLRQREQATKLWAEALKLGRDVGDLDNLIGRQFKRADSSLTTALDLTEGTAQTQASFRQLVVNLDQAIKSLEGQLEKAKEENKSLQKEVEEWKNFSAVTLSKYVSAEYQEALKKEKESFAKMVLQSTEKPDEVTPKEKEKGKKETKITKPSSEARTPQQLQEALAKAAEEAKKKNIVKKP